MTRTARATLLLTSFSTITLIALGAAAVPLPIANHSFESPVFNDANYDFLMNPTNQGTWGWDISDGGFIYNPQAGDYHTAGGNGTPAGADGSQIGGVNGSGDYSVYQRLAGVDAIFGNTDDTVVEPGTVYTLTVAIGQRAIGNPFAATWGGYDLQLLAGDVNAPIIIGRLTSTEAPPPGTFFTRTLEIVCPTFTHPEAAGLPLTIFLRKPIAAFSATTEYDNVRLDATKISPILNANFNESGGVDAADLALWKAHFGDNCLDAAHLHGNANGDDVVDGHDFLLWQRQLGTSPAVAAVPEPATAALIAAALSSFNILALRQRPAPPCR
jgi:hypothetical protein